MIIIMRFGKNSVLCPKYNIDIWILGGMGGDVHGPLYIFWFIIQKTEKVQEHDLYLNQILHHFDLKKNS